PLRVLAADDVAQNRELLARLLEREGHRITVVEDGAALLARYQAEPQAWDVLLLDLQMPGLDGVTACTRLRAWERAHGHPPVPVLALSASVLEADRAAAQRAGMDGFLDKPIDPAALRRALADVARRRPERGRPASDDGDRSGAVAADAVTPAAGTAPAGSSDAGPPPATAGAVPDAAPPSAPMPPLPVADPARGRALWGEAWRAQLHRWHAEQAHAWAGAAGWGRAEWHRVAGAAANLALPALAQAAQTLELAHARGEAPDPAPAVQAWQALTDWLAAQPAPPGGPPAAPAAPDLPPPGAAAAPVLARLTAACRRGEIDDAALAALAADHPAHAAALRAALDAFDFDAALALLARWSTPDPQEPPPDA
ncbi:MAG: response regulator, partial [Tepidimonas fonticaldi]|nr:response regulator [Tepidimonas fonticaldi]